MPDPTEPTPEAAALVEACARAVAEVNDDDVFTDPDRTSDNDEEDREFYRKSARAVLAVAGPAYGEQIARAIEAARFEPAPMGLGRVQDYGTNEGLRRAAATAREQVRHD